MRRELLSWACVLSLLATTSSGCQPAARDLPQAARSARSFATTTELLVSSDTAIRRSATSATTTIAPPSHPWRAPRTDERPVDVEPAAKEEDAIAPPEPAVAVRAPAPAPAPAPTPAPAPDDESTLREDLPEHSPRQWAVASFVGIGAVAVTMGNMAVAEEGTLEGSSFAITALAVGAASFGAALVLWATAPTEKTRVDVSLAPGMVGLRGTF